MSVVGVGCWEVEGREVRELDCGDGDGSQAVQWCAAVGNEHGIGQADWNFLAGQSLTACLLSASHGGAAKKRPGSG